MLMIVQVAIAEIIEIYLLLEDVNAKIDTMIIHMIQYVVNVIELVFNVHQVGV